MGLTTKSSYGVRGLINLAIEYSKNQPMSIRNISTEENISSIYLEQIFNRLKNCGIVKSVRGPKGGYLLERDPAEISVYDVVIALEGGILSGKCVSGKDEGCERLDKCASKEVWDEVAKQTEGTLKRFSLKYLAEQALAKRTV